MSILIISLLLFFFILFLGFSFNNIIHSEEHELRAKIQDRLKAGDRTITSVRLEKKERLSDIPFLDRILKKTSYVKKLQDHLTQAGVSLSVGSFLLFSLLVSLLVFTFAPLAGMDMGVSSIFALTVLALPFFVVTFERNKRRKRFSDRFPDAIGLLASSLRAGHSLQMALETVALEGKDIVSQEFGKVLSEIGVGQNFEEALKGILGRVDTPDLRLFISAVVLQRETGGNLAELLDNLELVIRERQELSRELKSSTAQARLSGIVLSCLPIFVGILVYIIHPEYIIFFFKDPIGKNLLWLCVGGQFFGFITIQKIVSIEL